jgi:hypothetical protein
MIALVRSIRAVHNVSSALVRFYGTKASRGHLRNRWRVLEKVTYKLGFIIKHSYLSSM